MRRLLLAGALLAVGCRGGADACDGFASQSCLALRVRGAVGSVDQIEVTALSGFSLAESRTPRPAGAPFALPVVVPLGLESFAGEFSLLARALREGEELGFGTAFRTPRRARAQDDRGVAGAGAAARRGRRAAVLAVAGG